MSLQVGELFASLGLETQEFDKGMGGITGKLGKLGGLVGGAMAGVAAAIGGAMVGAVVAVDDYQQSLNKLSAATGATAKETKDMGDMMKNIYANNYGENFQEIGDALQYAKQVTGESGKELENLAQNAIMLRDTFDIDINESLRGASQLMKTFGDDGQTSMAMIAEATQMGLDRSGDLIDTIDEYSVYFKTAGLSSKDMFNMMASASQAGVRNLDFVGDAFKEFVIRSKDGSKTTVDAFKSLGLNADKMGSDMAAGGEKGRTAFLTTMKALDKIKDPVEKNRIGVELFGTKFEDLEAKAVTAMGNLNGPINGAASTLNKINSIRYDSFGSAMQGIGRQLQVGLLFPIGEMLLPILNKFANWLASNIPKIVGFFQNLGSGSSGVFSGIKSAVQSALSVIGPIFMSVVGNIVAWWNTNGQALLQNFMIVFNGIKAAVIYAMPLIKTIIMSVFTAIQNIIIGAFNIISGVFAIFAGLFTGNWSKMWDGIKQLLFGAIQLIWGLINLSFFKNILMGTKSLFSGMTGAVKAGWNSIVAFFRSAGVKIGSTVSNMARGVVNYFRNLWNQARTIFSILRQFGESAFRALWNTIRSVVTNMVSGVRSKFMSMVNTARSVLQSLIGKVRSIFNSVKTAITNPIESAKNTVMGIINKIKGAFSNFKLKIPTPHIPKPSISWRKIGKGAASISIPDISWFKTGGVFNGPSVIGVGEAGPEAVVPLAGSRMKPFAQEIARWMGSGGPGGTIEMQATLIMPDGRVIAQIAEPHIQTIQKRRDNQKNRGWGRFN